MKITVGDKIWPDDFVATQVVGDTEQMYYELPWEEIDPLTGSKTAYEWVYESGVKGGPVLQMTLPQHDPVRMVIDSINQVVPKLETPGEVNQFQSALAVISTKDHRGYLKPQLGNILLALREVTAGHEWARYIEELEQIRIDLDALKTDVSDSDLSECKARQYDGYVKVNTEEAHAIFAEYFSKEIGKQNEIQDDIIDEESDSD